MGEDKSEVLQGTLDLIILRAWENILGGKFTGASFFAAVGLPIAACLTAFYMFRMIFMTFSRASFSSSASVFTTKPAVFLFCSRASCRSA